MLVTVTPSLMKDDRHQTTHLNPSKRSGGAEDPQASIAPLRVHRAARGLSQQALAERAGVGIRTVTRIEQHKNPTLTTARRLARALDLPLVELFPEPPYENPYEKTPPAGEVSQ